MAQGVKLDFDQLINNPHGRVVITIPGQRPVVSFMQSELTIFGRNEFTSLLDTSAQQELSKKANITTALLKSKIGSTVAGAVGIETKNLSNVSLINLNQTIATWSASAKPVFNLNLIFVALRFGDDVRIPAGKLFQGVYPTVGTIAGLGGGFLKAPRGSDASRTGELTTVQIGTWFEASRQVIKDVSFTFSNEVVKLDPQGTRTAPLFALVNFQFEPFRMITYREILGYIKQNTSVSQQQFFANKKDSIRQANAVIQQNSSGGAIEAVKAGINIPGVGF